MGGAGGNAFEAPSVRDYGDLVAITRDGAALGHVGLGAFAAVISAPAALAPGGGGPDVAGEGLGGGGTAPTPEAGDLAGESADDRGGGSAGGGGSGGASGGSGGELPFTGFVAAAVAAVGAGLSGAGAALRRGLRRG